jgi:DNA-binding NtrC family response regulator
MHISPTQETSERPPSAPAAGQHRVLLIDSSPEDRRKLRIAAFKKLGFTVYPALDVAQARSRCKPGRFDLIAVAAGENREPALQLCDDIQSRDPRQAVMLIVPAGLAMPTRNYAVQEDTDRLGEQVKAILARTLRPTDSAVAA